VLHQDVVLEEAELGPATHATARVRGPGRRDEQTLARSNELVAGPAGAAIYVGAAQLARCRAADAGDLGNGGADDEAAVPLGVVTRLGRAGPVGHRLDIGLRRLLGIQGTGDPDVIHVPSFVPLRPDPGTDFLVRRGGGVELPSLGDPANPHPLSEEATEV